MLHNLTSFEVLEVSTSYPVWSHRSRLYWMKMNASKATPSTARKAAVSSNPVNGATSFEMRLCHIIACSSKVLELVSVSSPQRERISTLTPYKYAVEDRFLYHIFYNVIIQEGRVSSDTVTRHLDRVLEVGDKTMAHGLILLSPDLHTMTKHTIFNSKGSVLVLLRSIRWARSDL